MSDETTVVPTEDTGFVPEPIPDNIADTDINGFDPVQSDDAAPVEEVKDETTDDQTTVETESEEPADEPEAPDEPTAEQVQPDAKELARQQFEQRQQAKAERDYVREQRQQIREYENDSETDTSDLEVRLKIMEAKDYINTVERNRSVITRDVAVAQEIPFFKAGTEQSQILFNQALENYANAYGVTDPDTGEWIGAQDRNGNEVPLLPFLQQQAATYEQALANAQATAKSEVQKTEAKMRAKAVNPSNTGKVKSSGDDLADMLERIGDTPLW